MKRKQQKLKSTLEALETMIQLASKGPSGFWVEDHEGCGNPEIFSEFKEGLANGNLVQKEHLLCPWNTHVLYGCHPSNLSNGCYYSCSIDKVKFLSEKMLKDILLRFRKRLLNGAYENKNHIAPLLTTSEINYIEKQVKQAEKKAQDKEDKKRSTRLKKAAGLIRKYPEYKEIFSTHYGKNIVFMDYDGTIDFSPQSYQNIKAMRGLSYDEYIELQINSFHKTKGALEQCYYNIPLHFKGHIKHINRQKGYLCIDHLTADGMFADGECFTLKEEHVWMELSGFEKYTVGDYVSFWAEIYRYVKTSHGKQLDFGLKKPSEIKKINPSTKKKKQ